MRFAGLNAKCRRNRYERSAGGGQRAIESGKTQIVTDGQAKPTPWQLSDHGKLAGAVAVGLPYTLAFGEIDIAHMDFVVARDNFTFSVNQERAIRGLIRRDLDRKR